MLQLPPPLARDYRPATEREVRSRSFGAVRLPRPPGASSWQTCRGTLDDERIFGPTRDDHCACGKYRGEKYRRMICDICGVKVTTAAVRRERFGHIELASAIPHPFGRHGEMLSVVPVEFVRSPAAGPLATLYEELLQVGVTESGEGAAAIIEQVFALLLPAALLAVGWKLAERATFIRGLALVHREEPS
jgi:hypothetical protein